ncbi:glycoside hydrolase [Geofilum rubicundum]|uniref:Putative xylanase n=1 Tax=Geofilum rubicundum JCM 15548 TaxID=1236989 RepID=A0A0E9LS32_9BACT|nr:glycoside hydrolase [Geofilum rubicundum]GAO28059.1 putative xylanase [Geofilum rubicundum JCM 15548]
MRIIYLNILMVMALNFISCDAEKQNILIDMQKEYQTIHSFGASDAWRCQFIGAHWPTEKKEQMAQWLFSRESDDNGQPLGIGLSLWRFNIGAGSMEQGEESHINHPWRKTESFLNADGTYDWSRQAGQQWFLQQAKKYGVEHTLAFTNSPPVHMTLNGQAYSDKNRTTLNIKEGHLDDYAEFLAKVCQHFDSIGLGFNYLSPINEPQWDWSNPSQEGSPASNADMFHLTRHLNEAFLSRDLSTQIALGEAAEYNFLYQQEESHPDVSNQLETFWSPDSPFYLGSFEMVAPVYSGHSYFTTWPVEKLIEERELVGQKMKELDPSIDFWQSEFCILEENDDVNSGHQRDLGMATALYVARVIHHDLVLTNSATWHWWTALTQVNYKDGLIYLDNGNEGISDQQHADNQVLQKDGRFHDSKLMWALGNYSRFVRPGMIRVEANIEGTEGPMQEAESFMVSAYKDPANRELVLVAVNYSREAQTFNLSYQRGFEKEVKTYTTSASSNLLFSPAGINQLSLPAQSVKTFVFNY